MPNETGIQIKKVLEVYAINFLIKIIFLIIVYALIVIFEMTSEFNLIFTDILFIGSFLTMAFIFLIVILSINLFIQYLYLNSLAFKMQEREFVFSGGIISRFERILPYSKLQHVIITRSLFERVFGLSSISLQTAQPDFNMGGWNSRNRYQNIGTSGAIVIPGLNKEEADKMRDFINLKIMKSKTSKEGL